MRYLVLLNVLFVILSSRTGFAHSIQYIRYQSSENNSIMTFICKKCQSTDTKKTEIQEQYNVPFLEGTTEKIEIKIIDGERKMLITENWMGGSPVVLIKIKKAPSPKEVEAIETDDSDKSDKIEMENTTKGKVSSSEEHENSDLIKDDKVDE